MALTQINNTVADSTNLTANNANFLGGVPAARFAQLSGSAFTGNISTTANVKFTGWQIFEQGTTLYFAYNGVNKMSLNTSGNLTVSGDVTGYGTP